ncbi:MAG: hypothetical protein NC936_04155, partial [Candidatus Omnitrophica bacterium]|nr:hypothetical protein [Candidatus Omnitrophota bacterium]
NRADLEKYIVGIIPAEQFHTRTIVKIQGSEKIINDKKGTHLTYTDISLTDFIVELTLQQTRQDFAKLTDEEKKSQKIQEIILKNIYKFLKVYEFNDFLKIKIQDTSFNTEYAIGKYELWERFKDSEI